MGDVHSSSDVKMRDMGTPGALGTGCCAAPTAGVILVEPGFSVIKHIKFLSSIIKCFGQLQL